MTIFKENSPISLLLALKLVHILLTKHVLANFWLVKFSLIDGELVESKGKVFYGQEPPSRESTTTECGVNYHLLAAITEVAQRGTPICSRPQPATDNDVRDGRSI